MDEVPAPPPWQHLPPELLRLVIQHVPSHAGRVRLRAVCPSWRTGAAPPLPPLLPWVSLRDGTFLSLSDGAVLRIPIPRDVSCRASTGSMLYLMHNDRRCSLMNPFSQVMTPSQVHADPDGYRKVVVMPDHIVTLKERRNAAGDNLDYICVRRSRTTVSFLWKPPYACALDIALFQEKLYILAATDREPRRNDLYVMDIILGKQVNLRCILNTPNDMDPHHSGVGGGGFVQHYLVAFNNRLLMVKQQRKLKAKLLSLATMSTWFEVFEAAGLNGGDGCWKKIENLTGLALFLSKGCSRILLADDEQCSGPRENCIYFLNETRGRKVYSGVYNMIQGTLAPLPLEDMVVAHSGPWASTWLFPPDT